MKRFSLIALSLVLLLFVAGGCQLLGNTPEGPVATPLTESFPSPPATLEATALAAATVPPEATESATAEPEPESTEPPPPTLPPATSEAAATDLPEEPEPTATPEATETAEPEETAEPKETPTDEATTEPPSGGELLAPGQQDSGQLASDGQALYPFRGTRFMPSVLFVEPENTLDVGLSVYNGELTAPGDLAGQTPLAEADNAPAGRPETLVFSPDADGLYTFVLSATDGDGGYTAHLFDLVTPANGMAVQEQITLEAGGSRSFDVTSNQSGPVLAMVDPVNLSDAVLEIFDAGGQLLTEANFSGAGGVEVAFVLPLGTTTYQVVVRERVGAPAIFDVAIVTLE